MTNEEFLKLSMADAVTAAFGSFKKGKTTRDGFDLAMKTWWRENREDDLEKTIHEVFGK